MKFLQLHNSNNKYIPPPQKKIRFLKKSLGDLEIWIAEKIV